MRFRWYGFYRQGKGSHEVWQQITAKVMALKRTMIFAGCFFFSFFLFSEGGGVQTFLLLCTAPVCPTFSVEAFVRTFCSLKLLLPSCYKKASWKCFTMGNKVMIPFALIKVVMLFDRLKTPPPLCKNHETLWGGKISAVSCVSKWSRLFDYRA